MRVLFIYPPLQTPVPFSRERQGVVLAWECARGRPMDYKGNMLKTQGKCRFSISLREYGVFDFRFRRPLVNTTDEYVVKAMQVP
jgi:hypothetical protein